MIYTKEQIAEVVKSHALWLQGEPRGRRANLSGVNLSEADLSEVNLSRANLSGANLSRVNLSRANLSGVNLSRANLSEANLSRADLSWANLSGANLSWANLSWANLSGVNLSGVNLSEANLYGQNVFVIRLSPYDVSFEGDNLRIGCKYFKVNEWKAFLDQDIDRMNPGRSLTWWKMYKKLIFNLIKVRTKEASNARQ